jgi:hypothetical protein
VIHMEKVTFHCATIGCGHELQAHLKGPSAWKGASISFATADGAAITRCPNCGRDFSRATAEQFFEEHGKNWS